MRGSLVYVMGPSGVGKDSLIDVAKSRLDGNPDISFATRYITREAALGGEDFKAVSQVDFDALEADNFFLFAWRSHGLSYGCSRVIEWRLAAGKVVVLNGSRAYLETARKIMPGLTPLLITASPEIVAARLKGRGRETAAEQTERLKRPDYAFDENISIIDNSGPLKVAAGEFVGFLHDEMAQVKSKTGGTNSGGFSGFR